MRSTVAPGRRAHAQPVVVATRAGSVASPLGRPVGMRVPSVVVGPVFLGVGKPLVEPEEATVASVAPIAVAKAQQVPSNGPVHTVASSPLRVTGNTDRSEATLAMAAARATALVGEATDEVTLPS